MSSAPTDPTGSAPAPAPTVAAAAAPAVAPMAATNTGRPKAHRRRYVPFLVLLLNAAVIAFTAFGVPVLIDLTTTSNGDDVTASSLAADVIRLERINDVLQKSLTDTKNAENAAAAARLEQTRTVVDGVAADLAACSSAMKVAADRMAELARTDPAAAPTAIDTMLQNCSVVAERAATAAEALDG